VCVCCAIGIETREHGILQCICKTFYVAWPALNMRDSIRTDGFREVGIVDLDQALSDGAKEAAEKARPMGLSLIHPEKLKGWYWCTDCGQPIQVRTAYRHKQRLVAKFLQLHGKDWVEKCVDTLDEKYGEILPTIYHTCRCTVLYV
jgi:hypothetical protein